MRRVMSSIMRWRSGLTRVSAIGGSCLEVRLDTPILRQDALSRDHRPRRRLPRERFSPLAQPGRADKQCEGPLIEVEQKRLPAP